MVIIEKSYTVDYLAVPFDDYITTEQARAYKPSHVVFKNTLKKLGCENEDILYDSNRYEQNVTPAHDLGWKAVWINREKNQGDYAKYSSNVLL